MSSTEQDLTSTVESEAHLSRSNQGELVADNHEELTADEMLRFQMGLGQLMEKRVRLFTSGESSSVPELTAHQLLSSLCYTLEIDLDALDPFVIKNLMDQDLEEKFESNLRDVACKVERISGTWKEACFSTPLLESIALKDTLESLREFPSKYNYRYFAHEIPCDIDYPLCHPVSESLQGVSYISEYLERLIIENSFMQQFDLKKCSRLLKSIQSDYKELIINLFEPVAANAIGLVLAGCNPLELNVSEEARKHVFEKIEDSSKYEMIGILRKASSSLCETLDINDERTKEYLEKMAITLSPRMMRAVADEKILEGVFLTFE